MARAALAAAASQALGPASRACNSPSVGRHHREILEHVPKELLDFFVSDMPQLFKIERRPDQMVPFNGDAL